MDMKLNSTLSLKPCWFDKNPDIEVMNIASTDRDNMIDSL